jgi:hypothetical protein
MVSFGFKITQPHLSVRPFRSKWGGIMKLVGHRFEKGGAPLRPRAEKCPHSRRNRATCVIIAPHFPSEWCPISPVIRTLFQLAR